MKRFLSFLLILLMAITPTGCISGGGGGSGDSGGPGGGSATLDKSDVTLVFNLGEMLAMNNNADQDVRLAKIIDFITMAKTCYAANLYDYITTLYIKVTGSGMTDIIRETEVTDPSSTFSETLTVPNGANRNFEVKLKDRNDNVLYSGDLIIDVGNGGASQDITIDVNINEGITAEDYIEIGRAHLEDSELERAFIAFDTAVSIERNHPVANFFRGFTHLLLLVQKDDPDPDVDAASPNADITSMLNLYSNLDNIYLSSIAPDIYNEDYGTDLENFFDDDWEEPEDVTTDSTVNVIENVILPELNNVINDLEKARANSSFSTTLTTDMCFDISSDIKVDRADACILEAIAYGLKAYYNHILAYQLRTEIDYWKDELEKKDDDPANYKGLQTIINNDPGTEGEEVLDLTGGASSYLSNAKSAYLSGLDKLKSGLQLIEDRSDNDKKAENHIFNVVDFDDNVLSEEPSLNKVNIDKVITNINEVKTSLNGENNITLYDDYDDATATADSAGVNLSKLFSTPDRDSLPELYYHSISDTDMPVFDTNNPASSSDFIDAFNDVWVRFKEAGDADWTYLDSLENVLGKDLAPTPYKFKVRTATGTMTVDGDLNDFDSESIKPVMFDEADGNNPEEFDLLKVYMAKDSTYLYIALKFKGDPYTGSFATGEYLSYILKLHAQRDDLSTSNAPVSIELNGSSDGWQWYLHSYGSNKGIISTSGFSSAAGDIVELKIPLSYIKDRINEYEPDDHFPGGVWDGKEIYVGISITADTSARYTDWTYGCLAELNI